jgi:hypothetical protein
MNHDVHYGPSKYIHAQAELSNRAIKKSFSLYNSTSLHPAIPLITMPGRKKEVVIIGAGAAGMVK